MQLQLLQLLPSAAAQHEVEGACLGLFVLGEVWVVHHARLSTPLMTDALDCCLTFSQQQVGPTD